MKISCIIRKWKKSQVNFFCFPASYIKCLNPNLFKSLSDFVAPYFAYWCLRIFHSQLSLLRFVHRDKFSNEFCITIWLTTYNVTHLRPDELLPVSNLKNSVCIQSTSAFQWFILRYVFQVQLSQWPQCASYLGGKNCSYNSWQLLVFRWKHVFKSTFHLHAILEYHYL